MIAAELEVEVEAYLERFRGEREAPRSAELALDARDKLPQRRELGIVRSDGHDDEIGGRGRRATGADARRPVQRRRRVRRK